MARTQTRDFLKGQGKKLSRKKLGQETVVKGLQKSNYTEDPNSVRMLKNSQKCKRKRQLSVSAKSEVPHARMS